MYIYDADDNLHSIITWFLHFTTSMESGEMQGSPYDTLDVDLSLVKDTVAISLQRERLLAQQLYILSHLSQYFTVFVHALQLRYSSTTPKMFSSKMEGRAIAPLYPPPPSGYAISTPRTLDGVNNRHTHENIIGACLKCTPLE